MYKRKSCTQWMELVNEYSSSGLNLTAWCKKKELSKSSIYPYLKRFRALAAEPSEKKWAEITIPKNIDNSSISLRIGTITLDINNGFHKDTLTNILNVAMNLC